MRVAVLWKGVSGYIDACVSALAERDDVIAYWMPADADSNAPYDVSFLASAWRRADQSDIGGELEEFRPDALLVCSWDIDLYRRIARRWKGRCVRVMFMDNQWLGTKKQWAGVLTSRFYLKPCFDGAFMPGERQRDFARRLGFSGDAVAMGGYSANTAAFLGPPSRSGFLFAGRLVEVKGVDILRDAYEQYCDSVRGPWRLTIAGTGPLTSEMARLPNVRMLGFVQPADLPAVMSECCCLVLPSRFEPWGVVVHEAASTGLHVIASKAVGAADDLVEHGRNGVVLANLDASALAAAMSWMHNRTDNQVRDGATASQQLAANLSPERWAGQLRALVSRLST